MNVHKECLILNLKERDLVQSHGAPVDSLLGKLESVVGKLGSNLLIALWCAVSSVSSGALVHVLDKTVKGHMHSIKVCGIHGSKVMCFMC